MDKLSQEAKEIVQKGLKIVGYTLILLLTTPMVLTHSFKSPFNIWLFILGIVLTMTCIGLMIWGISNMIKGFFHDEKHY